MQHLISLSGAECTTWRPLFHILQQKFAFLPIDIWLCTNASGNFQPSQVGGACDTLPSCLARKPRPGAAGRP